MERDETAFSINLDRLMTLQGLRNSDVAQKVGVSRQMVSLWRRGLSMPSVERERALAQALGCQVDDLWQPNSGEAPAMMPISHWATRENISIGRAKSLFKYGVLTGDVGGEMGSIHLVPIALHAPEDSKEMIKNARKADSLCFFSVNLDERMRVLGMSNRVMAQATDVNQSAVTHWRSGRGYPFEHRIPLIAKRLNCSIEDLMTPPSEREIAEWRFRYNPIRLEQSRRQAA